MSEDRRSYATLEFWMSVAAFVVGAFLASGALDPVVCAADACVIVTKVLGTIMSILSSLGYTGFRIKQKMHAAEVAAVAEATTTDPT